MYLVAGSYIFKAENPIQTVCRFKEIDNSIKNPKVPILIKEILGLSLVSTYFNCTDQVNTLSNQWWLLSRPTNALHKPAKHEIL